MAIYNQNQATVSQNHTRDCSRFSNEDDDVLSRESVSSIKSEVLVEYYRPKQAPNLLSVQIKLCASAARYRRG